MHFLAQPPFLQSARTNCFAVRTQYQQFAKAIERFSQVTYLNDRFYDPVRAEHRNVSFGFLSYSLPLDPESSRASRIAWDPIFFDLVRAAGGSFRFDLATYRQLDLANLLRSLAAGQVSGWVADQTVREVLDRLTRSAQVSPPAFDQVAARWDKLAGGEGDDVISAPSLLLGLARLCAGRLTKDATDPVLFPGSRPVAGERLVLRVQAPGNGKIADLPLTIGQWDEQTLEAIRRWLRDVVLPGLDTEETDEDEVEDEGESSELQVEVRREGGSRPGPLGSIILGWSPRGADLMASTGQSLASWQVDEGATMTNDWALLRRLFQEEPKTESCPEAVATACQAYLKALKGTSKHRAAAALIPRLDARQEMHPQFLEQIDEHSWPGAPVDFGFYAGRSWQVS